MTQSSKHRIPFKPQRRGSSAHLTGFSSRQGSRFIYTYDSMGRMLTRDDGTDLTTFTWDNWDCIKEVTGESETVYHIPQGQILSFVRDGERFEVHVDALGNCRMITDSEGEVVARYEYLAFGSAFSVSEDSAVAGFPMRFVGSLGIRFDALSGLHYMRNRWYSPKIQRFLSKDPIGLEGGSNLYAYVHSDPVDFVDPSGLQSTEEKYNALKNNYKTCKKDCHGFFDFLRSISRVSSSDDEFWELSRALFIPNGIVPKMTGWDPKSLAYNKAIDTYLGTIPYQRDLARFPEDSWYKAYQDDVPFREKGGLANSDNAHHLMVYLYVGSQGALQNGMSHDPALAKVTSYEVSTMNQLNAKRAPNNQLKQPNNPDISLGLDALKWGDELYRSGASVGSKGFLDWLKKVENIVCDGKP